MEELVNTDESQGFLSILCFLLGYVYVDIYEPREKLQPALLHTHCTVSDVPWFAHLLIAVTTEGDGLRPPRSPCGPPACPCRIPHCRTCRRPSGSVRSGTCCVWTCPSGMTMQFLLVYERHCLNKM